jgi:hypothetical protein
VYKYLEFPGSKVEKSILPKYSRRWKFGWSPGTANRLSYLQDNTFFVTEFRRSLRQKMLFILIFFDLRPVAVYAMNGVGVEFGEAGREVAGWDPGLAKPNLLLRIDARLIVQRKTVPKVSLA